jgi:hypothetical protein
MGDIFDDVNNGATDSWTFRGNVTDEMFIVGFFGFPYPDGLVPGTTYYWRIDEVNDTEPNSPWTGPVWSFWVPPRKAYNPDPVDGARFINTDVTFSWTAGFGAKLHYVHLGDNFDDVNSATEGVLATGTSYTPPGPLDSSKVYYWRVDESDGITTYTGDVWSFTTLPDIPITDPNLMGWWKFEEGSGPMVLDGSGHGNHGTFKSDPQRVAGYDGAALEFDGEDDFVQVPHAASLTVDNEVAVMAWIHTSRHGGPGTQGYQGIIAKGNPPRSYSLYTQSAGTLHFSTTSEGAYVGSSSSSQVPLNEWVHVAAMVAGGEHLYYINGEPAGTGGGGIILPGAADTSTVVIGRTNEGATRSFLGMIDDPRIYNRALTQEEIQQVMRGDTSLAWGPSPANGSTPDVKVATPLSWSPGDSAAQHAVYFGTDRDAVDNADTSDTTGVYRGQQVGTSYNPPEGVGFGSGPYYWRIDEHNTDATVSKGRIWSFTVADFLVVDDFESYNDIPQGEPGSNLVYLTWLDGFDNPATNGSTIGYTSGASMETGNVHGGLQSVPYAYDNNFKSSQATRTLTSLRDWTQEGVTTLSLWFYGDPANAPERMSVALNGAAPVYHADPSAATIGDWTQWPIDLSRFGVPLTNVTSITIGFGIPGSTAAGGTGNMLFDDIWLIR